MHVAFTTLACHDWTLDRIARLAGELAYDSVELRTFGFGQSQIVSDPALSDPLKVRGTLADHGVAPCCIATSLKFDRTVFPPVLGRAITDQEIEARQAKRLIDLAARMDCPAIRVYAFEPHKRESRASAVRRIVWRLGMAVDAARNTGVRVLLENGGGFATAAELREILDQIQSPWLGAYYSVAPARQAGEDPVGAIDLLGDRLAMVRLKGLRGGRPCLLADGDDPNADVVRALTARRFAGTLCYSFDPLWHVGQTRTPLPAPEEALRHAVETIYAWRSTRGGPARAGVGGARGAPAGSHA